MATYVKYKSFVEQQLIQPVDWDANTFKLALSNTAPNVDTHNFFNDVTEITGGGTTGYTAGGETIAVTVSYAAGTAKVLGPATTTWTAGASGMGPFNYVILYKSTGTPSTSPLIAYWAVTGGPITMTNAETFTVNINATNGILQLT